MNTNPNNAGASVSSFGAFRADDEDEAEVEDEDEED